MKNEETIKVKVLDGPRLNSGTPVVLAAITVKELSGKYVIPRREFSEQRGYQRDASATRIRALADELRKGTVDIPTAILVNIRPENFDSSKNLVTEGTEKYLVTEGPLFIVDGQHRAEALMMLFKENPEKWADQKISFICMLGARWEEEMRQFYVVNKNAKSVPTDLALDLLGQQARTNPIIMRGLIEKGQAWQVHAQELTVALNENSEMWRGKIRFPGQSSDDRKGTLITNTGMVTSLKPLYTNDLFESAAVEKQVQIVDAYWKAIKKILPEAFESPENFGIQKQTGAVVLHSILVRVISLINGRTNGSLYSSDDYVRFMEKPLLELEDRNGSGDLVSGSSFWYAGFEGAAGSYSSAGGQRVLTNKIKSSHLASPEIR